MTMHSGPNPHVDRPVSAADPSKITFLFTDIESSTRLWELDPQAMRVATVRHDRLIEKVAAQHDGTVVRPRGEGDSRFVVFDRAVDAVAAAYMVQRAFVSEEWATPEPLRVRMAIHLGDADSREGDYYGSAVNRCARLRAIGHGGQTLLSGAVADAVRGMLPADVSLRDLGLHRLKDLGVPERVWQLDHPVLPSEFPSLMSLDAERHNLPAQLSSFVGRETELAEVTELLERTRLLTLTGTGGVGKTRLALHTAAETVGRYSDGAWIVELAALMDPDLLAFAVAAAIRVRERAHEPVVETLINHLRTLRMLLVLDNCEHLVQPCAKLAARLLQTCPNLTILTTSREPLGIVGEVTWPVRPLSVPDTQPTLAFTDLTRAGSVALFLDRARAAMPDFALTADNALAVAQVCRRLDGLPLAIELAAARVRVLSPKQIAERLDDCFRLLTNGGRTAPARQQTLRATLDWSHDLLTEAEQTLLRRLAVFVGGFELDAVPAITVDTPIDATESLDLIARLTDKSLGVAHTTSEGNSR
jgi:predicted ATPase/class 3 adenylate cyclase